MTDLIDRADSGDIHRIDDLGIEATRDLSAHRRDTTGEHTENLAHHIAGLPPRRRPASNEDAKVRLVEAPLGLAGDNFGHPRWDIEPDSTVMFGVVYNAAATVEGELRPAAPGPRPTGPLPTPPPAPKPNLRRSVPYVLPAHRAAWTHARHARPAPLWTRLAVVVGGAMVAGACLGLAVLAVIP